MRMYKKLAQAVAVVMVVSSGFSGIYAKERDNSKETKQFQLIQKSIYVTPTTSKSAISANKSGYIGSGTVKTIDGKMCLVVSVEDEDGISSVEIDSKSADKYSGNSKDAQYYIEITSGGTYKVVLEDEDGKKTTKNVKVELDDDEDPDLELSQKIKNGVCYLVIKADDNVGISTVKVDGKTISFRSSGETVEYKVTKSGKYTVEVIDSSNRKTKKTFEVDVNAKTPSLTLDKVYKNNKWYLIIKAYPNGNADISKVTVNGSTVSCKKAGEIIEYAVTKTETYKVIVTDSNDQKEEKSLYIDVNTNSSVYEPALSVTQTTLQNVNYLVITSKANDQVKDNKLSKVTVNGVDIQMSGGGGTVRYAVPSVGTYTVVATDINGNQATKTCYVVDQTQSNMGTSTGASSHVVFRLNQTTWTKNGTNQTMDAAPMIRNGRIYIPIRYVAYALNIDSSKVGWDAKTQTATIYDGSSTVKVKLGAKTMTVNGVSQSMDAAAFSYKQRVYIPISQVAKAFKGVNMQWNNTSKAVTIQR